ncbi:MAG: hypothetical protein KGD73_13775 [Candidatus Lokiarchaeota archaeon]|nr:hypothetical protein [Candidatus Lokiarchaeota archaeon]
MTDKQEEEDYHGVAPIKPIIKKMKKEYDKDPKGWSVVGSTDDHGNSDTVILKKPNSFWLKSKMLSPYSALSMGSVVKNIDKEIQDSNGIKRDLSPDEMLRLFGMIVPINPDKNIIASGIERYSQHQGDILKKIIFEQNPNLDHQLAKRIDEEFTKKYPQRKNLYI